MAFITVADLGDYLRRDLSADDLATLAVDAACAMIKTLSGQDIEEVTDDELTLDGSGGRYLVLPQLPVTEVSAVTVDDIAVDADDYHLKDNGLLSIDSGVWCEGRDNIVVTYTHGYAAADVPKWIKALACNIAGRIYDQGLVSQESVGGYQAIYSVAGSLDLSSGEKNLIGRLRRGR